MRKADNLTILVPLSRNLGTLTSWNPLGHSWFVTGLIYFFFNQGSHFISNRLPSHSGDGPYPEPTKSNPAKPTSAHRYCKWPQSLATSSRIAANTRKAYLPAHYHATYRKLRLKYPKNFSLAEKSQLSGQANSQSDSYRGLILEVWITQCWEVGVWCATCATGNFMEVIQLYVHYNQHYAHDWRG